MTFIYQWKKIRKKEYTDEVISPQPSLSKLQEHTEFSRTKISPYKYSQNKKHCLNQGQLVCIDQTNEKILPAVCTDLYTLADKFKDKKM